MLWRNFADLFGMRAVVSRSYRIAWARIATSDNAQHEKWSGWQTAENFDKENVDELIKIRQYLPPSKFCAMRGTWY